MSWKWTTDEGSHIPSEGQGESVGTVHGSPALTASAASLAPGGQMGRQTASLVHRGLRQASREADNRGSGWQGALGSTASSEPQAWPLAEEDRTSPFPGLERRR